MSLLTEASLLVTPNAYKEGKLYSIIPSNGNGDFTVTRATTATRVNSAGLVDLVPYNLLQQSEVFSNAYWTKALGTLTPNVINAPNGTLTADLFTKTSAVNTVSQITPTSPYNNIGVHTYSIYVKKNIGDSVLFRLDAAGNACNSTFTFSTKTFVNSGANFISASFEELSNGWFRIAITGNVTSTSWSISGCLLFSNPTNDSVYIWGAQLVEGTSARDYLRTETRLNIPQIDYSLGGCPNILLEPQRANTIRNSTNVDTVVGAPGTLPTNWTDYAPGLTRTIVSTGTENGLNYIDIRYTGTTTDIQTQIIFDTGISTSPSVAWAQSAYLKLVSGTLPTTQLSTRPTGPSLPDYSTNITVTSSLTRFFNTFTVAATATAVSPRLYFNHSVGITVDFTIRIAGTQLELGNYATSYMPTTTASFTRNLTQIIRNNIFTNGLITAAGGTWFVELRGNVPLVRDQSTSGIFLNTGVASTIGNGIVLRNPGVGVSRMGIFTVVAGGLSSNLYTIPTDNAKIAIKWNGTTADIFVNAVKVVAATAFTPTAMENLIGEGANRAVYINEMALFTTPLTDTQCIALTT